MAMDSELDFSEDNLVAIVDTGCNSTCHGELWMRRYEELTGKEIPLEPHHGTFTGVGGQVQVQGKRSIPVIFKMTDGSFANGVINSIEIAGGKAPLLLSTSAQRKLGLVLDFHTNSIFSHLFKVIWMWLTVVDFLDLFWYLENKMKISNCKSKGGWWTSKGWNLHWIRMISAR